MCVDDAIVFDDVRPGMPYNSHTESFIGNNDPYGFFDGEIDDVSVKYV